MTDKVTRLPSMPCTRCKAPLDAHRPLDAEALAAPSPEGGCVTICLRCGEVMAFNNDMSLRRLSSKEFRALPSEILVELSKVRLFIVLRNKGLI